MEHGDRRVLPAVTNTTPEECIHYNDCIDMQQSVILVVSFPVKLERQVIVNQDEI